MRAVTISLDGLEQSHNWLRGNPRSFEKAVAAIRIVTGIPELRFDVVTCVHQRNFGELQSIKEILQACRVKDWRIFTIFPTGRAQQNKELQLLPGQFKAVFDFIAAERMKGDLRVSYGCEGFLGNYEGLVRDNLFFCRAGVSVASVLVDGSIAACPNLRGNYIQGNIYSDSFREVWENRYSNMRNRNWMQTGPCADCSSFKYCDGSGMHLRNEETGELLFCHYNRIKEAEGA
jgi:radical SAM protein with 4Fe4S-binding SPASM domain